jgi:hypothetical protein
MDKYWIYFIIFKMYVLENFPKHVYSGKYGYLM